MTGQQLKNSILQLAIQGKLVPQDPNDEPASELLKRIRKEKEQLVKVGKLKKKDLEVTPIAEDEKPFEIPESWEWVRLAQIVSLLGDGIHGTPIYSEFGDYYFINGNNLDNGIIKIKPDTKRCSQAEYEKYKKHLNESTMLVSINGTIGNYAFYNGERVFLGKSACYFNLMKTEFKPYLQYLIQAKYFWDYAIKSATGSTIKNVSLKAMNNLFIPLPPLSEQKRIVAKIEELLPLVEEYGNAQEELNKLNATLPDKLRQSILQEAIMGKLIPQDPNDEPASKLLERIQEEKKRLVKEGKLKKKDLEVTPITDEEKPFDLPNGWEWCRLGHISTYASAKKKINAANAESTLWGLDLEDIQRGGALLCKRSVGERNAIGDKTYFYKGDILYSKLRPYLLKILLATEDGICTPEIVPFRCYGNIFHKYIIALLKSPYVDEYINATTFGVKMPRVGTETMVSLLVPLPPLAEQRRIVAKLEEILPKLDELK